MKSFLSATNRSHFSSYLQALYNQTKITKTPFFTIPSNHIEIIEDPLEFYMTLNKGITYASHRLAFSSLYLGTGSLERHLLSCIAKKYDQNLQFQTSMVFDYNRSKRQQNGESSIQMLSDFQNKVNNERVKIAFVKNSNNLGVLGQISGVHHQKIYLFDDKVIIGGANLSKSYFLNRKDRYMIIKNHPQLADYLFDYVNILAENSYHVQSDAREGSEDKPNKGTDFSFKGKQNKRTLETHYKLWKFGNMPQDYLQNIYEQEKAIEKECKQRNEEHHRGINIQDKTKKDLILTQLNRNQQIAKAIGTSIQVRQPTDSTMTRKDKVNQTRQKLFTVGNENYIANQLMEIQEPENQTYLAENGEKVFIFPFLQFPSLAEKHQPEVFKQMVSLAKQQHHQIRVSSGYLNFSSDTLDTLFKSPPADEKSNNKQNLVQKKVQILCSAPEANSFYQGGFFKKYIPYFYRCFEYHIVSKYPDQVVIKQYNNKGQWSFHAKGVWIQEHQRSFLTIIGSSNYNDRSNNRDTELQLYMYSTCPTFNKLLNREWESVEQHCKKVDKKHLEEDKQTSCSWFFRLWARLGKRFL